MTKLVPAYDRHLKGCRLRMSRTLTRHVIRNVKKLLTTNTFLIICPHCGYVNIAKRFIVLDLNENEMERTVDADVYIKCPRCGTKIQVEEEYIPVNELRTIRH